MEKVSRSSGGGAAKLGTLDMQSYLQVMGRQLDEIQAQHQQFYASRHDRLGRLRSQEHPGHPGKRWSSESQCVPQQPGGLPLEYQDDSHCHVGQAQEGFSRNDDGSGALRSSSTSQGGARRSLLYGDESWAAAHAGAVPADRHDSPGKPSTTGGNAKHREELRAYKSTPPLLTGVESGIRGMDLMALAHTAYGSGERPLMAADRAQTRAAAQGTCDSPLLSESTSITESITPSAASSKLQSDTPGTPSTHNGAKAAMLPGGSRLGTASSSRTSPMRPYAVYDASGAGNAVYDASGAGSVSYATPDSRDGDYPLTASISSISHGAWQKSRGAAAPPSPSPGLSALQRPAASPSTVSGDDDSLAEHGLGAVAGSEAVTKDDCMPYSLALVGRPFDGIDSEEEDDAQPDGGSHVSESVHMDGAARPSGSRGVTAGSTRRTLQPDGGGNKQSMLQAAPQHSSAGADPLLFSHSRSGPRTPLVVASLETEEALRALLATPRFAISRSNTIGASVDAEWLEVPDDVLAALAKTDGMDLDAALGAARAVSLREQAAQEQSGSPPARSALPKGFGGTAQTAHGRHMVLGPGALTAVPVAVPGATASRGFDASMRSAGGAGGRAGCAAGTGSHPQQAGRAAPPVDASIEVDRFDILSQTMEVSADDNGLSATGLRDSAACAAVAMAAQVAAAQQHSQPVLYSLAPKPSVTSDKGSRRNTLDGECRQNTLDGGSRRNTVDGGSRRITADGGTALKDYFEEGAALGSEQLHVQFHAALVSAAQAATAGGSMRSELRPLIASPSAGTAGTGHGASAAGRASEGFAASASPAKLFRGGANTASPSASSAVRPGGDGDMVLYGSPSQKADAGALASVAASPYVPPSPPPGADPAPYISSPTVPHLGSRLQRNSRKMDEEAVAGLQRDAGVECGQEDAVGTTAGGAAELRPWSAASGAQSSSRRQLTQTAVSGTSSGANSVHLDLSLTQAAAAAATGGGRLVAAGVQQPSAASGPSPVGSQRQLRMQGSQHLPVLHKQQSEQQQGPSALDVPQQPAYSSFSLAGLSPPGRPLTRVASHDLGVDDVGRPLPQLPSPKGAAPGASSAQADSAFPSADGNRASRTQQQPVGPPLAAFSRAAALAAAADVGMAAPPPVLHSRPVPLITLGMGTRAPPADEVSAIPSDAGSTALGPDLGCLEGRGAADAYRNGSTALLGAIHPHGLPKHAGAAPVQEDNAADAGHVLLEHPELLQGQSPGPPSVASSAAKLSQLKARRQQQWQSQHGLQGGQQLPAGGATPQSQQPSAPHQGQLDASHNHGILLPGGSAADHNGSSAARGWAARQGTRQASGNLASEAAASRSPLAAAVGSPLLPDAVAEAIAGAMYSKAEASVSGELNLGHGISGLSVAIEAGQVKWAWQTDAKGKPSPGQLGTIPSAAPSPGGGSGGSSPWASPAAAHAAVRDSGAEWALQQLPAPQWQRHGQPPAGPGLEQEEERRQQHADGRQALLPPQLPSGHYRDARRRSEYSVAERQTALAEAGALQYNYAVSAGGFPTQEQHQPRLPSATDGGGQPNSKAMALLRLKQKSIMRHNVQVSHVKESEAQPEAPQQQAQQGVALFQPYQRSRASSAGTHQAGQQQQQQAQQRRFSAPRAPHAPELADSRQQVPRQWAQEGDDGEMVVDDGTDPQAQAKPFLRRRSAKVQARKVDWSHVKPRTNSRNPDYYCDQNSPDANQRARGSPLSSPRGGVSKPPLNVNVGSRSKKPGAKPPSTPTADKAPSAVPARRRMSSIPPAPIPAPSAGGAAEQRRGAGVGGSRGAGAALSPLDDLLAHVNTLLRDFDKIVL